MKRYLFKRFLLLIPTMALVSILAFWLQESAPGDPIAIYMKDAQEDPFASQANAAMRQLAIQRAVKELGADLPSFYISILPASLPDTLHRILPYAKRQAFKAWSLSTGDAAGVQRWLQFLSQSEQQIYKDNVGLSDQEKLAIATFFRNLNEASTPDRVPLILQQAPSGLPESWAAQALKVSPVSKGGIYWKNLIPRVHFHGLENRYHRWISGMAKPENQRSWMDGQPVWRKIGKAAKWTLLMNGIAILLAYGLSIPLGVWMASRVGTPMDTWISQILFGLYAVPTFWLGTLLLVFFTSPVYGMHFFPSIGLGDLPPDAGWWDILRIRGSHLFLPVLCITYGSLAYLTRQVRNVMIQELKKDYIRTAWAKGLSSHRILWRHAFRNALFPLITLFAYILPATIAGSVAIEVIFNIPGMGRLSYAAILSQDWPLVYGILFLAALLTLAGSYLADWMYSYADPRIRYSK